MYWSTWERRGLVWLEVWHTIYVYINRVTSKHVFYKLKKSIYFIPCWFVYIINFRFFIIGWFCVFSGLLFHHSDCHSHWNTRMNIQYRPRGSRNNVPMKKKKKRLSFSAAFLFLTWFRFDGTRSHSPSQIGTIITNFLSFYFEASSL